MAPKVATKRAVGTRHACAMRRGATSSATSDKVIAANYILQLSSLELQDVINQELQENPALDLEEVQACPLCGQPLAGRVCLNCFGTGKGPYKGSDDIEAEPLEGTSLMQRDEEEDEL